MSGPHWQFSLKHLFGLTTIVAIAAALAARWGAGTLLTSVGFFIAWLNLSGAFESLQSGRRQYILLWLAWGMFLLSLALPAVRTLGTAYGYGAAWFAIAAPIDALRSDSFPPGLIWYLVLDLANLLAALMPIVIWRIRRGGGRWLVAALHISMVATWFVCWDGPLLIGYYVWCSSFLLALIALPVRPRTFAAMIGMAIFTLAIVKGP